jgi:nucleoid-associated protein YgaU
MFVKNSRYFGLPTTTARDGADRDVAAVKLRALPVTMGDTYVVKNHDRLDVMAEERYGDATRYWVVADANTELEVGALTATAQRPIRVPPR